MEKTSLDFAKTSVCARDYSLPLQTRYQFESDSEFFLAVDRSVAIWRLGSKGRAHRNTFQTCQGARRGGTATAIDSGSRTSDMSGRMLPLPDGIEMIFVSRLELLNVLDEIDAGALPPTDLQ